MSVWLIVLVVVVLLVGFLLWAGGGKTIHETQGSGIIESIPEALEREPAASHTLVVLSYAIGYGLGTQRRGRSMPDAAAVYDRLDRVVETIAASGADVALLQEVDFASQRTHHIDQLSYIAASLGWGFAARALTWECHYVPWPPTRPTGRLRAGMGVISRYALVQNIRQRLAQPRSYPLLAPLFLPYHTVQMVDVHCGMQTIRLFNVHLGARESATQQRQAQELLTFVQQMATPTSVLIGTFNAERHIMQVITEGLRSRFRMVADTPPIAPAPAPHTRLVHVFSGSAVHVLECSSVSLGEPVSAHRPVVLHVRCSLPLTISNGRG
jgi:endonuclease/exonuclease/phosphatase family metal-dependent hydrolase